MTTDPTSLHLVLLTGMSGSGKSVALHALEDLGFYCVDNLPPELLSSLISLERTGSTNQLAIAMDVRSASSLPLVPQQLLALKLQGVHVDSIFLDANTDMLIRRYSETRRRHPLSEYQKTSAQEDQRHALTEAIELERELLSELRADAHVIDTSIIRPTQLQSYIKDIISVTNQQMTLVFESFSFKRGLPSDADYVFDVRMLPNPHYEPTLRALTGRDEPVIKFFQQDAEMTRMLAQIHDFLENWLDALAHNHRSYVTVAIGCTGGQHRSVYIVEQLNTLFCQKWSTLKRHREMDAR
ncbi:RNase adapter protein RapZ [Rhodoferax lithotrophicus]|uniref:RNase adapter protein RapZ n=1 Tax=Rhodoferax lithotrophicus TaxID=2798804 RepID=A0ABM7MSI7_9BURK|nr:RNase adapter RapZ [Rhodoferax sp. MIZ03]BCO29224.1 RNase adapter protein RapZ [Rhodoferax sp. MIZ03]